VRPVNLIPKEQQRRGSGVVEGRAGLGVYILLGFLAIAVLGVASVVLTSNKITKKEEEVAQIDRDTASAKAAAEALRPYGNFAQMKQSRVDTVNSLVDTSFNWERTLRSLSRTIPSNAWLTSFTGTVSPNVKVESEGGSAAGQLRGKTNAPAIALSGCTYSHSAVARMMVRMRNIDDVSDVVLQSSEKSESADESAQGQGDSGSDTGDDCRTNEKIAKFEILVVLGYDKTQAAAASVGASAVGGTGSGPVAAAQGAVATASSSSSSGASTP
jgi:Tfp pilus assembly protein PilN